MFSTLTEAIYLSHVFSLMYAQKLCMTKIYVSQARTAILQSLMQNENAGSLFKKQEK